MVERAVGARLAHGYAITGSRSGGPPFMSSKRIKVCCFFALWCFASCSRRCAGLAFNSPAWFTDCGAVSVLPQGATHFRAVGSSQFAMYICRLFPLSPRSVYADMLLLCRLLVCFFLLPLYAVSVFLLSGISSLWLWASDSLHSLSLPSLFCCHIAATIKNIH